MAGAAASESSGNMGGFASRGAYRPLQVLKGKRLTDRLIELFLLFAAVSSILVTFGIVFTLVTEAEPFFTHADVTFWRFLTEDKWAPAFAQASYGILPLLMGTLITSIIALLVAVPVGSVVAIWLSEYAPFGVRTVVKPAMELLAAVPTVVYGYFAVQIVIPYLNTILSAIGVYALVGTEPSSFNMLGAGLVMGIMIIPYVSSLSEDAMRSVPMLLREGAYAMGSSKLGTSLKVVYPAALSGIASAYILAISRAVGETMIVAIAAGQKAQFTVNPLEEAATITAQIVQMTGGDLPHDSLEFQSVFAAGLTLFIMTLVFNLAGMWIKKRYRQAY